MVYVEQGMVSGWVVWHIGVAVAVDGTGLG